MQQYKKILGKVMMTAEGTYDSNKEYDPISLITDEETGKSYISRKEVPAGTQINNREYWQPVASSGIIDNGVIILNRKNSDGQVPIYDLKSAAEAVAIGDRKGGVILGFLGFNPETDTVPTWKLYQYNDVSPSNWNNIDYWLPMDYTNKYAGWFDNEEALYDSVPFPKVGMYAYVGNSASSAVVYRCYNDRIWQPTEDKAFSGVVNLADEEDITSKQNKLKFKDKEYNPAQYNGMGRIYLRKNIVGEINVLTQNMMQATNTIYIIQYDYDLQGETITIPEACTLDFQGGSLNNGSISFNNTKLQGDIKLPLSVRGIIDNEEYDAKWFGAKGDGITDDTQVLNWCFNNLSKVYIPNGIYNITNIVIENPYYGKQWRGDLAYANEYAASSGASVVFRHIGSGNMIEFKDDTGHVKIYNICLVTTKNTTNAIYFDKEHQATFFRTEGLNIWAKNEDKNANGVSLGKGFGVTFNNFTFSGLNIAIEIPYKENGWFTEAILGSTNNSYIIDCNQAFSFHYGNDIIINNVLVERVGKVIDVISHGDNKTHVTFNNCYFEDYAKSGEFTFNMMDTDTGSCAGLLLNNCNFLYNILGTNIFKSNGNLILQNNKGLNIGKNVVSGRFINLFNDEFYTAFRKSYNMQNDVGLYQVDWHNFLGSKNFAISDKFAMGHPNGEIDFPQSLKLVRRFKVTAKEISENNVNVPVIYFPFDDVYLATYELKISILFPTDYYNNLYFAKGYGTTSRWKNMILKEEVKEGGTTVTTTRSLDETNRYIRHYLTLTKMKTGIDMYIDVEINVSNAYLHIQPTYGVMDAIDTTKYIPNLWRIYILGQGWKMYDSSTKTWNDIP